MAGGHAGASPPEPPSLQPRRAVGPRVHVRSEATNMNERSGGTSWRKGRGRRGRSPRTNPTPSPRNEAKEWIGSVATQRNTTPRSDDERSEEELRGVALSEAKTWSKATSGAKLRQESRNEARGDGRNDHRLESRSSTLVTWAKPTNLAEIVAEQHFGVILARLKVKLDEQILRNVHRNLHNFAIFHGRFLFFL